MRQWTRYVVFVFAVITSFSAYGQIPDTARRWSITDCFRYASEHNIQINTLRLNELSSLQDLSAARGARIPSLSASVSNSFHNANNDVYGNGSLVNQLTSNGIYTINSSVVLWNDNAINYNIQQKELLTQSAGLLVQQSLNNITLSITQSFLEVLLAKENLKYVTDLVNTSQARKKQGELFFNAGSIARKDLLQLQAQLASDKYLLVQTQNAIRQNILSLKQLLQLPVDTLFDIAVPDSVSVATSLPSLSDVQQVALSQFPDLQIGKLGVGVAGLDIAKARAGFKPVLTANGALGSGYNDVINHAVLPKTNYLTQTGNNFYQNIGFTLFIPIFSNRLNKTNLEKANIAYKQANLSLQNDQLALSQAVEQAYLNALNAMQSYDAASQQLQSATESYRIVSEQFKLGATNTYDLLQQRNQYVQAVQAYTQAKYSAVLQQKIYEFYMGNPVTL